MQTSSVANITTYQSQLLQFLKRLFHARLIHLNLHVFLAKSHIEVFLAVIVTTGMFVQCARFNL